MGMACHGDIVPHWLGIKTWIRPNWGYLVSAGLFVFRVSCGLSDRLTWFGDDPAVKLERSFRNRCHHLLKTFCGGPQGWRDRQLPDSTVIWTSPSGLTCASSPGSLAYFPTLCRPTAPVERPAATATDGQRPARGLAMPRRRRTRAQDRAHRIAEERRLNEKGPAVDNHPDWLHEAGGETTSWSSDPPPF